jgi:hypothetical protein
MASVQAHPAEIVGALAPHVPEQWNERRFNWKSLMAEAGGAMSKRLVDWRRVTAHGATTAQMGGRRLPRPSRVRAHWQDRAISNHSSARLAFAAHS